MQRAIISFLFVLASFLKIQSQETISISDQDWFLWPDTKAEWKTDAIFLPGEFKLSELTINPPTGGWEILKNVQAKKISLPSTVEQHYWGAFGFKDYENAYGFETEDKQVRDGRYLGVSWWYKDIQIPENSKGKRLILKIPAARLRAEVYLNQKLVGYHIITETSFESDITEAINFGQENQLAIRITNPGGQMDWIDPWMLSWGDKEFHRSHGFGGLDQGLQIEVHPKDVTFKDLWVLNTKKITTAKVFSEHFNHTSTAMPGNLNYEFIDKQTQKTIHTVSSEITLAANESTIVEKLVTLPKASIWTLENPHLYTLTVIFEPKENKENSCARSQNFGFRWFEATRIGKNAHLELNHKRIRMISAISWGFWGLNGLFPSKQLAIKEVKSAKKLGLNTLHFHRNIGKTQVFKAQDSLGLLRVMEPGGGRTALQNEYKTDWVGNIKISKPIDVWGAQGDPKTFAQKYMQYKIEQMVKDHRSHPSLIAYNIQNEMSNDLANPRIWNVMRAVQKLDPSRIITLKSGTDPFNQVLFLPYQKQPIYDKGDNFSGWYDEHTVGGPGVWKDDLYTSPSNFTHKTENKKEIVVWGEMLGAATPDNHSAMIDYIQKNGATSYDLRDHKEQEDTYNEFLDKWHFRNAFPTTEKLYKDIARKSYDFWGRVLETARLSEANDGFVINGWESTAIENHSGLVDNQRRLKAESILISERLQALRPVIKAQSLVLEKGKRPKIDLFVINETHQKHPEAIDISIYNPKGEEVFTSKLFVPKYAKNKFVYPLHKYLTYPQFEESGIYKVSLCFSNTNTSVENTIENILVIDADVSSLFKNKKMALIGENSSLKNYFKKELQIALEDYNEKNEYDLIVFSEDFEAPGKARGVKVTNPIARTGDDFLFQTEVYGNPNQMSFKVDDIPKGKTTVTLKFAEVYINSPQGRLFDIAINGKIVENDFDIFAEAGQNKALNKNYVINNDKGYIQIDFPKAKANKAKLCAFKIQTETGKVLAYNMGGASYNDVNGLRWQAYVDQKDFIPELDFYNGKDSVKVEIAQVFEKIKNGTKALFLPNNAGAVELYGKVFNKENVLAYQGQIGDALQSWMGSWVFTKVHPVFNELPVNQSFKSYYQVGAVDANGMLIDGNGIDVFAGYGRDHYRGIGASSFTVPYAKGQILVHTYYGLGKLGKKQDDMIQDVIGKKLLINSLSYLLK
ncbi:hypothetical protein J8281_11920 [Aquimarina sp. U1-2]|uniref:malectin domain-containing carbohydrate-binding protein n=1 Tax=Aquimarina sp. U1-2 TaxID=2823141 RepID=UPI001AEC8E53|nr:malectin domain-containing carbohydrate-binding protein [Aquimarina sp. U1-2]MBP2832893.1 hypothetical protein [Aquimarina sp. U1-2]